MAQDICLNVADASLASGLELSDGAIRHALQRSIAEFDDGTLTGVDTRIESAGGIITAATHLGFCYMQDGDDNGDDFIHSALPADGEHIIIKFESFGGGTNLSGLFYFLLVALTVDGDPFGEDDWILWIHQALSPTSDHVIDHNIRRIAKVATITTADTNNNIDFARIRHPLWIKIARSGDDYTISYRVRWDASFTDDITLTNANIHGGHFWLRCTDGNRYLIDWIRNDTAAFVTTSPAASWTGLTGIINTTNAAVTMLQAVYDDLGIGEGDQTVLADGTDRVEFRFNGGSWLSLTAWKALGEITPTSIDIRLISDATQQIQIKNILVGEGVGATAPAEPTLGTLAASGTTITQAVTLPAGATGVTKLIRSSTGEEEDEQAVTAGVATFTGVTLNRTYHTVTWAVEEGMKSEPVTSEPIFPSAATSRHKAILDLVESKIEGLGLVLDTKQVHQSWTPDYDQTAEYPKIVISPGDEPDDVPDRTNVEYSNIYPVRVFILDMAHGTIENMDAILLIREQLKALFKEVHAMAAAQDVFDTVVVPFSVVTDSEIEGDRVIATGLLLQVFVTDDRG